MQTRISLGSCRWSNYPGRGPRVAEVRGYHYRSIRQLSTDNLWICVNRSDRCSGAACIRRDQLGREMSNLRCNGLRKSFGGFVALDGISIEFPASGIWALVGPNGAGKTTLLNILTGHLRAEDGRCYLGKEETTHLAPYRIARLGLTRSFQRVRLFWGLSAVDNILTAFPDPWRRRRERFRTGALGRDSGKSDLWNAHQLLDWVQLAEYADVPARKLSYGQQKLLSLMCCVATGATVFLLDEPVAGLDQTNAGQILKLLI